MIRHAALVAASCILCAAAHAATLHVPAGHDTIQASFEAAVQGDTRPR